MLMDDRGHSVAQAGDLPDTAIVSQLVSPLMASLSSSEKISHIFGQDLSKSVQGYRGSSVDLVAAPVGQYALLIWLRSSRSALRLAIAFEEALNALESARISVEDVGATLRDYAGGIHASPEHLADVENRLATLDRLKRKYGPSLDEVIKFGEEVTRKVCELENKDEILRTLQQDLKKAAEQYLRSATWLSKKRHEAARKLEKQVEAEVNELAMKASFKIEISSDEAEVNWTGSGLDQVVYMIATNPGEPLRRLEQIASGGELSRVMLALKVVVEAGAVQSGRKRSTGAARTLVFDEVDTGIGGRAAEAVGKKLKALARGNQVLCVTHLPQIATFADHHYLIEKKESGGRTRTTIRAITGEARTEEVARMLSVAKLTETSRKHAEQMLKTNA
jgi:DNA repair protein RecN (Recombination protein N)